MDMDTVYDQELAKVMRETELGAIEQNENNPDNGSEGWWHVVGMRHDCLVMASSAIQAVNIAHEEGRVDKTWEVPIAKFKGTNPGVM